MATVRVASTSRSRSSARSAYRPNQNRSLSTRGTIAEEAEPATASTPSSPSRPRGTTIRAAATGPLPMTQTSLASPPSGSVTSGPRLDDLSSSVTRASPPSIAVYEAPLRTANERSTTLPRTSRS